MVGRKILSFGLLFFLLLSFMSEGVTISPSELTIRSLDERQTYEFIVLLESQTEGLVDVEIKSGSDAIVSSPDKFMMNEGEQKSIRVHLNPRSVEEGETVNVQPHVNDVPSQDRLSIKIEETNDNSTSSEVVPQDDVESRGSNPINLIIYGLMFAVAMIVILIFLPEMKKTVKNARNKTEKVSDRNFYKNARKNIQNLGKRLDKSDKAVKDIVKKVEKFHDESHRWLSEKSGGKYGLE